MKPARRADYSSSKERRLPPAATLLRARGAGIACTAAAATIVVAEEAFVEDFFFVAPAFGASLTGALVLGVVLARLAQSSALRSGEDALALGALAAAVAGTRGARYPS